MSILLSICPTKLHRNGYQKCFFFQDKKAWHSFSHTEPKPKFLLHVQNPGPLKWCNEGVDVIKINYLHRMRTANGVHSMKQHTLTHIYTTHFIINSQIVVFMEKLVYSIKFIMSTIMTQFSNISQKNSIKSKNKTKL